MRQQDAGKPGLFIWFRHTIGMLLVGASLALWAAHTPQPSSVTIAGDLQSELGCPGDWQPDCAATHLDFDTADAVWQGIFLAEYGT